MTVDTHPPSAVPPPPISQKRARKTRVFDLNPPARAFIGGLLAATSLGLLLLYRPGIFAIHWPQTRHEMPIKALETTNHLASQPEVPAQSDSNVDHRRAVSTPNASSSTSNGILKAEIDKLRVEQEVDAKKLRDELQEERAKQDADLRAARERIEHDSAERERQATEQRLAQEKLEAELRSQQARVREQQEQNRLAEEAERKRRADPLADYSGPRTGTFVWEGDVRGRDLITVENGVPSSGTIISGTPPTGVPLLFQPTDAKRVGLASTPSPRNGYRIFVFRVAGNGKMRVLLQWSVP